MIVIDRLRAEACPTCVADINAGRSPGPLGASHDVGRGGTATLRAERVSDEASVSLGPCDLCGSTASIIRTPVRLVLMSDTKPSDISGEAETV